MQEIKKTEPRRYPKEYPHHPEKYTQEIVAIDRIEFAGVDDSFSDCHRQPKPAIRQEEGHEALVRQESDYDDNNKAAPDNNLFFEERSNPLSSKGN
ncbi:MAG: hypothetical protein HFI38_11415 [Lachnospiraceae bacterium]|jgi:hypothetical protein|nr:hypothetical protein [Lachnospiraceae bacterium]